MKLSFDFITKPDRRLVIFSECLGFDRPRPWAWTEAHSVFISMAGFAGG